MMLNALRFAWISSIRQPAKTGLGVLGIAAIGALLFDMLLLSRGLVISFHDLLDDTGFDVRILATDAPPPTGPSIPDPERLTATVARLPEVDAVVPVSFREGEVVAEGARDRRAASAARETAGEARDGRGVQLLGVDPEAPPLWTLLEGRHLPAGDPAGRWLIVNRAFAWRHRLSPGSHLVLHGTCGEEVVALRPGAFTVAGIGEFPFDEAGEQTAASPRQALDVLCAAAEPRVDMMLVRSRARDGGDAAAAAIRTSTPGLYVVTNAELVEQFSRVEFSYFRQISVVLATVTLVFGFLLITVLLTASVNQRLAEIAALRALGLSRTRVTAGVLAESALMIGSGAVLAVPVGFGLAAWLDDLLKRLPGIPVGVHFFVYERRVLMWYTVLLVASAIAAALYPMRIVSRLPIAATLRREVIG
jgi:ABC-type lipoprotein release transport system permease subunit